MGGKNYINIGIKIILESTGFVTVIVVLDGTALAHLSARMTCVHGILLKSTD